MTLDPALDAEVRSLVDEYRERCLWIVRSDPKVNSQGNKDLLSNPLQFAIKFRSAGPDCTDSADCGACP